MKKAKLFGALALACVAAGGSAQVAAATTNDAAAPYITKPGVNSRYAGSFALFSAHVFCGQWKGIAQLQIGTQGVAVLRKSKLICEHAQSTNVTFTIAAAALPVRGRYEYTFKVGRHDSHGNPTRWTHALHGFFVKS